MNIVANNDKFERQRRDLIDSLEEGKCITSPKVKAAMLKVRREDFVLGEYRDSAYNDYPLPIPSDATISAPHMHAMVLSELNLKPGDCVLEVGAGSGILLAYMKELVGSKGEVTGIEIKIDVYRFAKNNLEKSGYSKKVSMILGDISRVAGKKKFDKIIVSATSPDIPKVLVDMLKTNGMLIIPVGNPNGSQTLVAVKKTSRITVMKDLGSVMFVPLEGEYGWK